MLVQQIHRCEQIEHLSFHYLVDRMAAPSFRLAVRIASLGKLLRTIFTFSGLTRAGYFQDTSVCTINGEAITAVCFVPIQFEPELFIYEDRREKCMLVNLCCTHTSSKLTFFQSVCPWLLNFTTKYIYWPTNCSALVQISRTQTFFATESLDSLKKY